jgi:hypothetical protein
VIRAPFRGYFLGQLGTFVYLVEYMGRASQFNVADWPQFSIYNLVVANFWPLYWVVYFVDSVKLEATYWHIYEVAQARAADVAGIVHLFGGQA